ncbi:hypothetical protein ACIHAX_36965 [Nocardia sp. NPDC051929]|uniref:hypothetical protein n=1 Tax=unclassified Nocardia TaxID=2637762 RepID=UPI0034292A52
MLADVTPAEGVVLSPLKNFGLQDRSRAEACLRSARAFVFEQWADIQVEVEAGNEFATRQHTLLRLTLLNATNAAEQWSYRTGGGTALREGAPQRSLRDIHAATQHVLIGDAFYKDLRTSFARRGRGKGMESDRPGLKLCSVAGRKTSRRRDEPHRSASLRSCSLTRCSSG